LINEAEDNFREVDVDGTIIRVYSDKRVIWQSERTVIVFISERFKTGQIQGIYQTLSKKENCSNSYRHS
jgi:hypothetical protein